MNSQEPIRDDGEAFSREQINAVGAENPAPILEFQGENRFLSNMWRLQNPIETEFGPAYTSEHVYQMSKFVEPDHRRQVFEARDGKKAKRVAERLVHSGAPIVEGWYENRVHTMYHILFIKFLNNPDLSEKLVSTGNALLEEGNRWEDTYWGVSPVNSGNGANNLGKVLTNLREVFKRMSLMSSILNEDHQ